MADCTVRKKAECRKPCGEAEGISKRRWCRSGQHQEGGYNNIVDYLKLKETPGNFFTAICVKMRWRQIAK